MNNDRLMRSLSKPRPYRRPGGTFSVGGEMPPLEKDLSHEQLRGLVLPAPYSCARWRSIWSREREGARLGGFPTK